MDCLILLRQAREAGLQVGEDGDRLVIEGPRRLEAVARALIALKPEVLRALAQERTEVAWRIDAMRPQLTSHGPIPLLLARPHAPRPAGRCYSCGDPLAAHDRYCCRPCAEAVQAVLATARTPFNRSAA